jgi:hypothetical protein
MPQARLAGRQQHHGASLQDLPGRGHLRASSLVLEIVLRNEEKFG